MLLLLIFFLFILLLLFHLTADPVIEFNMFSILRCLIQFEKYMVQLKGLESDRLGF